MLFGDEIWQGGVFGDEIWQGGGGPHTKDQLLYHDCCFCITPWKLQIARYR